MISIRTLYNRNHKLYDYKVNETEREVFYRHNDGKPFKVFHKDGTCSIAYGYGEKQFTYDYDELMQVKKEYIETRKENARRKELVEKFKMLSTEEMIKLLEIAETN